MSAEAAPPRESRSISAAQEVGAMVKLTVLYGHPTDSAAFERYYAETHMPLTAKIPGPERVEASLVVGTPDGSPPGYYRIFEFWFTGVDQMQASMGSSE